MNLAVIGSGGREHSICYKLKQSNKINKLICLPGNAGTKDLAENINIDIKNFQEVLKIIQTKRSAGHCSLRPQHDCVMRFDYP